MQKEIKKCEKCNSDVEVELKEGGECGDPECCGDVTYRYEGICIKCGEWYYEYLDSFPQDKYTIHNI